MDIEIIKDGDLDRIKGVIGGWLPDMSCRKIVIKPNWVYHEQYRQFPIDALVTDARLIDATIESCLLQYPELESLVVGDVPLQTCDWDVLVKQAGIDWLIEKYNRISKPTIQFLDLRRERYTIRDGYMVLRDDRAGDPKGYVEIDLGTDSFLEEISNHVGNFRVADYDPIEMASVHAKGHHKYLICRSVLDCDLFINLPKMKTHQKAGITGALKNLVGINGAKSYLVHHRKGRLGQGGDEFPESISNWILWQTRFRDSLQKRSKVLFRFFRLPWQIIKGIIGVKTTGTREYLAAHKVYTGAGSWYGNDTIWRMIYDLNKIILFSRPRETTCANKKQREYLCILDGVISGEGNGPLQPLSVGLHFQKSISYGCCDCKDDGL